MGLESLAFDPESDRVEGAGPLGIEGVGELHIVEEDLRLGRVHQDLQPDLGRRSGGGPIGGGSFGWRFDGGLVNRGDRRLGWVIDHGPGFVGLWGRHRPGDRPGGGQDDADGEGHPG
ncbi:MAG: hypothetical protein DRJ42_14720 [Deltaproteobacteria bacterium]|nr:MAG: hypothetical protein DRJ42_14720 [Deltaproteobacteria bacterium]